MVRETATVYDGVVDPNGRIVLPADIRRRLGLEPGDGVVLRVERDGVRVMSRETAVREAQAAVRAHLKPGASLVKDLLALRAREARRE
jgi:AbrB family looped-hinge helix DNA binding protein